MKNLFIVILLFFSLCLMAQNVPQTIDYQGRLADSDGNYLNSVVTVDFLIYDAEIDGTLLWSETQDVNCANGVFHVLLGSTVSFPTDLFDNADRWLELVVSGETLSPRTVIASVPYSLKAEDTHLLNGLNSTDFMPATTDNWVNTTGDTLTGNLVVNADFKATGITYDSDGDAGTSGQIFSSTASGTDWIDTATTSTYYIGQSYGGGIIFWLDASGQHGLIAATVDQSSNIPWTFYVNYEIGATLNAVYAGKANTDMIISVQGDDNYAAQICDDYSVTINNEYYDDWYLPSKYELNLMYLQKAAIGGFAGTYYWSSTEYNTNFAWRQHFVNGDQNNWFKIYPYYARAIRAF